MGNLVGDPGGEVTVVQGEDRIRLTDEQRLDWLSFLFDIALIFGCLLQSCRG